MAQEIPFSVIPMSIVQIVCGFALPAAATLLVRKRFGGGMKAFRTGCAVFIVLAGVLESLVHQIVLGLSPVGPAILDNIWLYALYGGAMAGLFEELGRCFAFRRVLRKEQAEDGNALMYGAGHGGVEAFCILAISAAGNLVYALLLRAGRSDLLTMGLDAETARTQLDRIVTAFEDTAWWMYLLAIVERVLAMTLHLALSVLVWFAAKDGVHRTRLLFLAIGLHFAVDFAAVLLSRALPAVLVELAVAALTALAVLTARSVWRKHAE